MSPNIQIIQSLIRKLQGALSEEEWKPMVVSASSAIMLNGVELERPVDDLDLFAPQEVFDALSRRMEVHTKPGKEGEPVPYLQPLAEEPIEIYVSFRGLNYHDVLAHAVHPAAGLGMKVCCLTDVIIWKTAQGRPKDFADIETIRAATNAHRDWK
jgi:hypothetical protein